MQDAGWSHRRSDCPVHWLLSLQLQMVGGERTSNVCLKPATSISSACSSTTVAAVFFFGTMQNSSTVRSCDVGDPDDLLAATQNILGTRLGAWDGLE